MAVDEAQSSWLGARARLVALPQMRDERGSLLPFDHDALPFVPRRCFVVSEVPAGTERGRHAHRRARQLLVRLAGRIEVEMRSDDGDARCVLDRSDVALLIEPRIWAAQTYLDAGAMLLVLADEPWHPDSYCQLDEPR